jgi:hypothetical protein
VGAADVGELWGQPVSRRRTRVVPDWITPAPTVLYSWWASGRRSCDGVAVKRRPATSTCSCQSSRHVGDHSVEVGADAEGGDDGDAGGRGRARWARQVIEVVVGQQHDVERRQLVELGGGGVEAAGADEGEGRDALGEHRIGEHAAAVELEDHGAVAEPGGAEAGDGGARPELVGTFERQRTGRLAVAALEEELADDAERGAGELGAGERVAEVRARELADARCAPGGVRRGAGGRPSW